MRLCSPFLCFASLVCGALVVATLAGCYPQQGKPVETTPDQLMKLANQACRRHDPAAWQMLLTRLARRHPHTVQGRRAQRILARSSATMSSCQGSLPEAKTRN